MGYSQGMWRGPLVLTLTGLLGCAPPTRSGPAVTEAEVAAEAPAPPPRWAAQALALNARAAVVLGGSPDALEQGLAALTGAERAGWRAEAEAALDAWAALPEADRAAAAASLPAAILGDLDRLLDALTRSPSLTHAAVGPPEARLPSTAARLLEDQQIRAFQAVVPLQQASAALAAELADPARLGPTLADPARRSALLDRLDAHARAALAVQADRLAGLALAATYMEPAERAEIGSGALVSTWLLLAPTPG